MDEVSSAPGVLSAASSTTIPLLGNSWTHGIEIGPATGVPSQFAWASPDYFKTMGIPILAGRGFDRNDTASGRKVAVVNQKFIQMYLGNANPLGKSMRTLAEPGYPSSVYEIVGVMADTKYANLRGGTPPMTIAPASQLPAQGPWMPLLVHSNGPSTTIMAALKRKFAEQHPQIIIEFEDFRTQIEAGLARDRLMAMLSGFFGLLAALLTTLGLYGVIAYIMSRRRNEIGIRMALGARSGQVVGMVMREAARLLAAGLVIGVVLALVAGRSATSLLFDLKAYDPATMAAACLLLAVIAFGASYVPARKATRVDPMAALRQD